MLEETLKAYALLDSIDIQIAQLEARYRTVPESGITSLISTCERIPASRCFHETSVKPRFKTALVTFTLILFSTRASGQVSPTELDAIFSSLRSSKAPGVAVLVVRHGRPVFRRGYGVTDLRTLRPIDENTNFRLASFTKQFTAAAIMLLARDGKLHNDDHLTDFFPEF